MRLRATTAASARQLGGSVQEIGRQVQGLAQLARTAGDEASQAAALVQELNGAMSRIGEPDFNPDDSVGYAIQDQTNGRRGKCGRTVWHAADFPGRFKEVCRGVSLVPIGKSAPSRQPARPAAARVGEADHRDAESRHRQRRHR